jgi:hypothetical protein
VNNLSWALEVKDINIRRRKTIDFITDLTALILMIGFSLSAKYQQLQTGINPHLLVFWEC